MTLNHDADHTYERLLADLQAGELFTRIVASEALGQLGDMRAVGPLVEALHDPEWRVSAASMSALGALGDTRAAGPIVEALRREEFARGGLDRAIKIADAAIPALQRLGEPGFQVLLAVLREFAENEPIGAEAASALGTTRDPRALETLLFALRSPVFEVGGAASVALSELGESAVAPLVDILREPPGPAQYHARQALCALGPDAIPHLLVALSTADVPHARAELLQALAAFEDERVLSALHQALSDPDQTVCEVSAFALGRRGDPAAIEQVVMTPQRVAGTNDSARTLAEIGAPAVSPLLDALADTTRPQFARVNAATALGEIGDERALEPLIAVLRHESAPLRLAAVGALGHLKHPRSVQALLTALDDEIPEIRRAAILSLSVLGGAGVFEALTRIATDPVADSNLRAMAGYALGRLDRDRAVPIFRAMLADESMVRSLHPMLASLGSAAIPPLLETVHGESQTIRVVALRYLSQRLQQERDARIIELCASLLCDGDSAMRRATATMLGRIGDPRAVEALMEMLTDPHITERVTAAQLLERIGDARALPALEVAMADGLNTGAVYHNLTPGFEEMARDAFQRAILSIRAREQRKPG